jgi:hypothetical protein
MHLAIGPQPQRMSKRLTGKFKPTLLMGELTSRFGMTLKDRECSHHTIQGRPYDIPKRLALGCSIPVVDRGGGWAWGRAIRSFFAPPAGAGGGIWLLHPVVHHPLEGAGGCFNHHSIVID